MAGLAADDEVGALVLAERVAVPMPMRLEQQAAPQEARVPGERVALRDQNEEALREHQRQLQSYVEAWCTRQGFLLDRVCSGALRREWQRTRPTKGYNSAAGASASGAGRPMEAAPAGRSQIWSSEGVLVGTQANVQPGASTRDPQLLVTQPFVGSWVDHEGIFNGGLPVLIAAYPGDEDVFRLQPEADGSMALLKVEAQEEEPQRFLISLRDKDKLCVQDTDEDSQHIFVLHRVQQQPVVPQGTPTATPATPLAMIQQMASHVFQADDEVFDRAVSPHSNDSGSMADIYEDIFDGIDASEMRESDGTSGHYDPYGGRISLPEPPQDMNRAMKLLRIGRDYAPKTVRNQLKEWVQWRLPTVTRDHKHRPIAHKNVCDRLVWNPWFEFLCALVILANSIFIAWSANYQRTHIFDEGDTTVRDILDSCFCTFYTVEWCVRVGASRCDYVVGKDWRWNVFDTLLVVLAIYDQLTMLFAQGTEYINRDISFLRVMRIVKMLKLLRMIRLMKMFRELRLILNSIFGSLRALLWSMFLLVLIVFIFGMCFLQATTEYILTSPEDISPERLAILDEFWGDGWRSMLSMYMACAGGEDWRRVAEPLKYVGPFFYGLFLFYTFLYTCVIANTFTSLFVEATMNNADKDQDQVIKAEMEQKDYYVGQLQEWYKRIDADHSGSISYEEIEAHLEDREMVAFASRMGIDLLDVKKFYDILSSRGKRKVDLGTFVVGCMKLHGTARSMDLAHLIHQHYQHMHDLQDTEKNVESRLAIMEEQLGYLCGPAFVSTKSARSTAARSSRHQTAPSSWPVATNGIRPH